MNNKNYLKIYAIGATVILILIIIITILATRSITLESINSESQAVGSNATDLAKEGTLTPDPSATLPEQANSSSVVAVESDTSTPHEDSTPPTTPTTTAPSPNIVELYRGEPFNAGCSLPDGDLVVPQSISRADSWDRVGEKILLPRKKDIGPEKVTGSVRHCFAKSGEGLVYAAVTYMTQSPSIEEYSSQSAQKLFIHPEYANDGKTQVLVGPLNDAMPNVSELKPVGWEITDLNELDGSAEVNVAYLSRGINGAQVLASSRARLKWANGDWRLVSQSEPQLIEGLTPMMQLME